jgi:hypothetical protein
LFVLRGVKRVGRISAACQHWTEVQKEVWSCKSLQSRLTKMKLNWGMPTNNALKLVITQLKAKLIKILTYLHHIPKYCTYDINRNMDKIKPVYSRSATLPARFYSDIKLRIG